MSGRRFSGLAAALSAGGAVSVTLARSGDAPALAAKPRLSVCIDALFTDVPFEERPAKVKAAGVDAFAFWGWRGRNLDLLAKKREELGMEVVGFACDTGGPLVAPGRAEKSNRGFLGLEMWPTVDHAQAVREAIAMLAEATMAGQ